MIAIGINGACGRMGGRLVQLVHEDTDLRLAAAVEFPQHPDLGRDVGECHQLGPLGVAVADDFPAGLDVLIDFSAPDSTVARAAACAERGTAMVIGTTGLDDAQQAALGRAAESVPVFMAPNMSLGVNLMFKVAEDMARILGLGWDPEIVEVHHRFKKDSPSGTALRLAEHVAKGRGQILADVAVYGRQGLVGERDAKEIAIHAVRTGDVVGDHTLTFGTLGERIEIKHTAQTRDTFARGALAAAKFVAKAQPGLYGMGDLLSL